ncbi:response regulator [Massilia rhizosphaerae]|uniref:response regulator n=1 Tax=Massilia rhizosphaerae TaxID=2784389 RepID=UPI0018DB52AA|nr:response regulator [Massilia rhizosphaerae]
MKYALLFDDDPAARRHSAALLKSLGYLVAETTTAQAALNATRALHFDVILTASAHAAGDRRALPGELSRLAPDTPTILLLDDEEPFPPLYRAFSATVTKPATVRGLRHALEFGLDGMGARPVPPAVRYERRDGQRRRHARDAMAARSA